MQQPPVSAAVRRMARALGAACLLCAFTRLGSPSASAQELPRDLTAVSLEDLTRIKITSVSKKQQSLEKAAAAVHVVTAEDIRRMGATSIPEALRFVPGVQVARLDASKWAVSVRGFNGRYSNKLLVLIDGRPIYSPLFSSVFWEMYDVPMEEIERIEVVRGPGATMWGANAVNGVINVITKSASALQGGFASFQGGSHSGPATTIQYGGAAGPGAYRIFARTHQHFSANQDALPTPVADGWRSLRTGMRYEADLSEDDRIEVLAGAHRMDGSQRTYGPLLQPPFVRMALTDHDAATGFALGRWRRTISERSELSVQAYYDHVSKSEHGIYRVLSRTAEVEVQHRFRHNDRLDLNWGGAYRAVSDRIEGSSVVSVLRPRASYRYASVFFMEEAQILRDELYVTVGAKLEQNTLGGFVMEPTARVLWSPSPRVSLWAAASRAGRAPSRGEVSVSFDVIGAPISSDLAGLIRVVPNPDLGYETVVAYETGFRTNVRERLTLDLAFFDNHYRDRTTFVNLPTSFVPQPTPHLLIPIQSQNVGRERGFGAEGSLKWRPSESWDLGGALTLLRSSIGAVPGAFGPAVSTAPGRQLSLQSHWRILPNLELSLYGLHNGSVGSIGVLSNGVRTPGYVRGDARLEWRRRNGMRVSVGVHDAFAGDRYEIQPDSTDLASPMRRNVYGRVEWGF